MASQSPCSPRQSAFTPNGAAEPLPTWTTRRRDTCILCHENDWQSVLDLGNIYVSAFPLPGEELPVRSPLHLYRCRSCDLVQLRDLVNPDLLYRTYWYRSGTNETMRKALRDISRSAEERAGLVRGDVVVDIGSNDNTLLRSYEVRGLNRIGFEPSNIAKEAKAADPEATVHNDYFRALPELAGKAKVVTSIAMFYDLEDPHAFIEAIRKTMKPGGLWILQLAYLPYMFERNAFDGICHEHIAYYSLATLERLLREHNLGVEDVELVDINEGSLRLYISEGRHPPSAALSDLRAKERAAQYNDDAPYQAFGRRIESLKRQTLDVLRGLKGQGRIIHGYGASTKGNTLLQYFGIGPDLMPAIWERQSQKWGRVTVGTGIPIVSEADGRNVAPDYLFMLPWHFAPEFLSRERTYLESGGHFVIPLPTFRIM